MRRSFLMGILVLVMMLSLLPIAPMVGAASYGDVEGRVTYNGVPVVGAKVMVFDGATELKNTTTDSQGMYSLNVSTGDRTLKVELDGFVDYSTAVTITEGVKLTENVALQAKGLWSLDGRVETAAGGLGAVNVTVSLINGALPPVSTMTNSEGHFSFQNLVEGEYRINVSRDAFIQWIVPKKIVLDGNLTLDNPLAMKEAYGSVIGTVANGTFLISDALVKLLDSDGVEVDRITTNTRGEFEFLEVPTGSYTVVVERTGFHGSQKDIRINASAIVDLDFDLERVDRSYLFGQDLAHSLMIIGIGVALVFLALTVIVKNKILRDPSLLYHKPEEEED